MIQFSYESQGTVTYLVYQILPTDRIDTTGLGMITNNRIKGFAPAIHTQLNNQKMIKYDVSSRVTAKQVFSDEVTAKRLLGIFNGIADAFLSADEYMISPENVQLDLEHIYVDVSNYHAELICVPLLQTGEAENLPEFLKKIMFQVRVNPNENGDYFTRILNMLNTSGTFSLEKFKALLEELSGETPAVAAEHGQPAPVSTPAAKPAPIPAPAPVSTSAPKSTPVPTPAPVSMPAPKSAPISMPVPKSAPVSMPVPKSASVPKTGPAEKPMSMLYLLQHYSKENLEKYKEQKNQAKSVAVKPAVPGKQAQPAFGSDFQIPGQPVAPIQQPVAPISQPVAPVQQPVAPISQPVAPAPQPAYGTEVAVHSADFGQTAILDDADSDKTVILGEDMPVDTTQRPMLIRKKNNEQILLRKDLFTIGKEAGYADYVIRDNRAISRSHASFITRDGCYYVVDTNSTNHVYVDGMMIPSNQEIPVIHGMKIRLADEEFEFRMY